MNNNKCLHCGSSDHFITECPWLHSKPIAGRGSGRGLTAYEAPSQSHDYQRRAVSMDMPAALPTPPCFGIGYPPVCVPPAQTSQNVSQAYLNNGNILRSSTNGPWHHSERIAGRGSGRGLTAYEAPSQSHDYQRRAVSMDMPAALPTPPCFGIGYPPVCVPPAQTSQNVSQTYSNNGNILRSSTNGSWHHSERIAGRGSGRGLTAYEAPSQSHDYQRRAVSMDMPAALTTPPCFGIGYPPVCVPPAHTSQNVSQAYSNSGYIFPSFSEAPGMVQGVCHGDEQSLKQLNTNKIEVTEFTGNMYENAPEGNHHGNLSTAIAGTESERKNLESRTEVIYSKNHHPDKEKRSPDRGVDPSDDNRLPSHGERKQTNNGIVSKVYGSDQVCTESANKLTGTVPEDNGNTKLDRPSPEGDINLESAASEKQQIDKKDGQSGRIERSSVHGPDPNGNNESPSDGDKKQTKTEVNGSDQVCTESANKLTGTVPEDNGNTKLDRPSPEGDINLESAASEKQQIDKKDGQSGRIERSSVHGPDPNGNNESPSDGDKKQTKTEVNGSDQVCTESANKLTGTVPEDNGNTKLDRPSPEGDINLESAASEKQQIDKKDGQSGRIERSSVHGPDPNGNNESPSDGDKKQAKTEGVKFKQEKENEPKMKSSSLEQKDVKKVHFHVVVSPEFDFDPDTDEVFIRFNSDELDKYNRNMLKCERKLDGDKRYLMHALIPIPKDLLRGNKPLEYKYAVNKTGRSEENCLEFVPKKKHGKNIVQRELSIPKKNISETVEWHQYDGALIRRPEKNLMKKLRSLFQSFHDTSEGRKMLNENKTAYKEMLPQWISAGNYDKFDKGPSAEEIIEDVSQVFSCVKQNIDEDMAKEILYEYISPQLSAFSMQDVSNEDPEAAKLRLAAAFVVVILLSKGDLSLDKEDMERLCCALCLRPDEKQVLNDFTGLSTHFPKTKKKLKDYLKIFLLDACTKTPMWVLDIPLLHLLKEDQTQTQVFSAEHKTAEWWGTLDIEEHIKRCHSLKQPTASDIGEYKKHLEPLLTIDQYLSRTLAAIITWKRVSQENIDLLTIEALLGNLYFSLESENVFDSHIETFLNIVQQAANNKRSTIQETRDERTLFTEIQRAKIQVYIGLDVIELLVKKEKESVIRGIQLIAIIIESADKAYTNLAQSEQAKIDREYCNAMKEIQDRLMRITEKWTEYRNYNSLLKCFNELLAVSFGETTFEESWRNNVMILLERQHKKIRPTDYVLWYYIRKITKYHPLIEQFLEEQIFYEVELYCQGKSDITEMFEAAKHGANYQIKDLLSQVFEKKWPKDDTSDNILDLVLCWPGFVRYLSLIYDKKELHASELLSEHTQTCIQRALSVLNMTVCQLLEGSLSLTKINQLEERKQELLGVQKVISKNESINSQTLELVLKWRKAEVDAFRYHKKIVARLTSLCQVLGADVTDLTTKLESHEEQLQISDVCDPRRCTDTDQQNEPYEPFVTYFSLQDEALRSAKRLLEFNESEVFRKILKRCNEKIKQSGLMTVEKVIFDVWPPAETKFNKIFQELEKGEITLADTRKYFDYMNKPNLLKDEFSMIWKILKGKEHLLERRVKQVEQCFRLCQYQNKAKLIKKLVRQFQLKGDFTKLDVILSEQAGNNMKLKCINDNLLKTAESLLDFDDNKKQCVEEFLKCKKLVEWLRKSLKGPNEVKLLVDLALITASGQGDMEVHKVKCLHDAVVGYAPLIYELKPDADLDKFLEILKSVWRSLDSDPDLSVKLKTTQDNLEWLKRVKESKGSMEMGAFEQVEQINKKGIYKIGKIKNSTTPKSVEEAIQLVIPGDSDSEPSGTTVSFTYKQLNDLQSRLMLVAGRAQQGNDQVDRFVEILDGVTRMATVYLKLCNAGSILFRNWMATFYCQPNRNVITMINFGLSRHLLHGYRTDQIDVTKQISLVCDFLDTCLVEWDWHIEKERTQFPVLNYFTMEQLVILRKKLAVLFDSNGQPDNSVYALLHPLHKDCTANVLRKAFSDAFTRINSSFPSDESLYSESDDENEAEVAEEDEAKSFISKLTESGFTSKLAHKALKNCGADNYQEALLWCMEKQSDETSSENEETNDSIDEDEYNDDSIKYTVDRTLDNLTASLLESLQIQKSSLITRLEELWNKYIETVSVSLKDFVSVEHLGLILTNLEVSTTTNRPLPEYLRAGQPNLILCPEAQILQVILSLYIHGEGKNKPLPQRDEVLVCSVDTKAEEVELILRRASFDESGKLYCLADVGQLKFDVAQKAEAHFENYCKNKPEIRLVVICSRETENRSHIVNYLEKFRVQYTTLYDLGKIQNYLKHHFTIKRDHVTASTVDPDCCCVRLVKSHQAAAGKSLKVHRMQQKLENIMKKKLKQPLPLCVSVAIHRKQVDVSSIMRRLGEFIPDPEKHVPRIFHFDLDHEVIEGVNHFLFNLLILGSVMDKDGAVWQRSDDDLYVVETMPLIQREITKQGDAKSLTYVHSVLYLLPSLTCWNPVECLFILRRQNDEMIQRYPDWQRDESDQLMDDTHFRSEAFQRPYQYLKRYNAGRDMNDVDSNKPEDDHAACLEILIRYCGIVEPSWAELSHFVHFLNIQLLDCELSDFCHSEQDLPGFRKFVVKFMISMSRDFATRSLAISEQTPKMAVMNGANEPGDDEGAMYIIKRRWETSPHPYVFFNADPNTATRHSMTFIGFTVTRNGDIVDARTKEILDENVISPELQDALRLNHVNLNENFDQLPRHVKIERLCKVFGSDMPYDPDPTYELTTDNVKKILAIHMRFRCGIPVIIMGETGCGKTRLIKFMCDLCKPPGAPVENLILIKVHGGTSEEEIESKVNQASEMAKQNRKEFRHLDTVLFFDEANTTECIGLIKEIMCDHRLKGKPLGDCHGLKFVVACNPYRRHSDEVIKRLEQAGLGYHVKAEETRDRLGHIPMRHLVYRVHALPQSMLPLVWDFGQLTTEIETLYIKQMVQRYIDKNQLPNVHGIIPAISRVLASSQAFMKQLKDESSFVSLRDVDRVLSVMAWFHKHRDHIFPLMDNSPRQTEEDNEEAEDEGDEEAEDEGDEEAEDEEEEAAGESDKDMEEEKVNDVTRILILSLGVCYHASLLKRHEYRENISQHFQPPLILPNGSDTIRREINRCQEVFLENIVLERNIARNQALKENLFMMIICTELRIPLFLVGKPGSSKSLAKTIVNHAMQGDAANNDLFRHLKQVHMVSFQCSPLSTSEGIIATFRQCAQLQDQKDLERFVAVVVLDEVGLAEDSPLMPLKALHPLLEDGCIGDEKPAPHKKVACVAISNWALDPAKMNRGIHVQRGVPGIEELKESAKGICSTNEHVLHRMECLVQPLAEGYLQLYKLAVDQTREFFGLRDFYSLVKMVYGFSERSGKRPTWHELKHAILRNFGGLDRIDPITIFETTLQDVDKTEQRKPTDPECTQSAMIHASLFGDGLPTESRYLLILTENYAALSILQQELLGCDRTTVIFGSSFPKDQEYTQVCRNINKIKICMEAGRIVVLLNLENLYESLYDALNQYYVKLGNARFVDLGLGTQRMKCEVHKDFKLVVVAEKQVVYEKFPIPLINRLEKHILTMSTMLTKEQLDVLHRLEKWTKEFVELRDVTANSRAKGPSVNDVFIGFHVDTPASVVIHVCKHINRDTGDEEWKEEVLERSQDLLLQCATPDSVVRLRNTRLPEQLAKAFADRYNNHQKHGSLLQLLEQKLINQDHKTGMLFQITTHSKLLSSSEVQRIGEKLGYKKEYIMFASLHSFDTEHQFCKMLRDFLNKQDNVKLLFIQCVAGNQSGDLIACTRHILRDESSKADSAKTLTHIILIVQLARSGQGNFIGFQGGQWISYHIDELQPESKKNQLPNLSHLEGKSLASLYKEALFLRNIIVNQPENLNARRQFSENDEVEMMQEETNINSDSEPRDMEVEDGEMMPSYECMVNEARETTCRMKSKDLLTKRRQPQQECMLTKPRLKNERAQLTGDNITTRLDVDSLVHSCIHKAAAMLKDDEVESHRKTERIPVLLYLLGPKPAGDVSTRDNLTVLDVFHKRICMILREKEDTVLSFQPSSWLCREAASLEYVRKAGTFREALNSYVESKIVPILAGLVAYTDRNRNLDIIQKEPPQSWIYQFWLRMFNDSEVTPIKYSNLQTLTVSERGQDLTEFKVETSGFKKTPFSVRLPFSWVIFDQINSLVYQVKAPAVREDPESFIERLLMDTPLGQILKWVADYHNRSDLVERYLHDFVHMVYKAKSDHPDAEYELIMDSIRRSHREQHTNINEASLTLAGVHLTYNQIQKRINLCAQAIQVCPDLVKHLESERNTQNTELFQINNKMVLDIQVLYLMLKEFELDKNFDNDTEYKTVRRTWLRKADAFFPVIECIFDSIESATTDDQHGPVYQKYVNQFRCQWTRILVLYLFVQHVCPPTAASKPSILYKCMALWGLLKEDTDMKKVDSLCRIEKFILSCNKVAASHYFKKEKCRNCDEVLDNPVMLPCKHYICMKCVHEMNALDEAICPRCKASFPPDIPYTAPKSKENQVKEHNQYKQRCNAFFMDLVSRLCFNGTTPPEMDVIKKLMSYVICEYKMNNGNTAATTAARNRTHKLGILKDSLDPTPVVRSFLLQLLLRSNIEQVRECLQEFFIQNKNLLSDSQHVVELSFLYINCFEDHYFTKANNMTSSLERMQYVCDLLNESSDGMRRTSLDIHKLESLAAVRFALSEVARIMHAAYVKGTDFSQLRRWLQRLFHCARQVCIQGHNDEISKASLFLIKELFHRYGQEALEIIASQPDLQWVLPPVLRRNQGDSKPDVYLILGDHYKQIRNTTVRILLGEEIQLFSEVIQNDEVSEKERERNILLAIYREITTGMVKPKELTPKEEIKTNIGNILLNEYKLHQQDLLSRLLANRLAGQCRQLSLHANHSLGHMTIIELLVHYWIVINSMEADKLAEPLRALLCQPQDMMQSYLPTMPNDHLDEVRKALLDARYHVRGGDTNPVLWQCPNGHPYVIGDCGRPYYEGRCTVCGETIGGRGHVAAQGNQTIQEQQHRTSPGHILGRAQQRSKVPVPERLNKVENTILGMMVHMSMYIGANRDSQSVRQLVRQPAQIGDISEFLWEHLNLDLELVATVLGKNKEDAALFMHLLLKRMLSVQTPEINTIDKQLKSENARREWEIQFTAHYITPVLKDTEESLRDGNKKLAEDDRLGNNPLFCLLYRVHQQDEQELDIDNIQEVDRMWSVRSRITIEHLTQEFQKSSPQTAAKTKGNASRRQEGKILELFLREEHHLRGLRCLPGIVQLQRILSQKCHRNIDTADAVKMTIGEFKEKYFKGHHRVEFEELLAMFSEAWDLLRGEIGTFAVGGSTLPAEYCEQSVDEDTCLAMLLPTLHGQGLCATALVHRLVQVHNDFMEEYSVISKQSLMTSIIIQDITQSHLVCYNVERDLMPIILANCNYTLKAGQRTQVEYDFLSLERQIEERFIRGRPRLIPDVTFIVYREQFTNASIFMQLENKIKQQAVQGHILQQVHGIHLTDLNDSLATLDITIGFLISVGGDKDAGLLDYIEEKLKMDCGSLRQLAQKCSLKHVKSLWLLLSHERAKHLTAAEQDAFDQLPVAYHEELNEGLLNQLSAYFRKLQHRNYLLPQLYEFIILHVAKKPEDPNSEDYVDNTQHPLGYSLYVYLESREYPDIEDSLADGRFPDEVLVKHCVSAWKTALKVSHTV